jgi:hypothetical protein
MAKSPILASNNVARSPNAADTRAVNLFQEKSDSGFNAGWLQRTPGLKKLKTIGTGPIRGMWVMASTTLYVVSGTTLYQLSAAFDAKSLGTVPGTGIVSMVDNGVQLFIAANPTAYVYDTSKSTFAQVTDPNFPGAVMVSYLDGYFVINEPNSGRVWTSAIYDGKSWDALSFATAESNPDNVVATYVAHNELWVFGSGSTEVWYDAGTANFPLARIQGATGEIGCVAPYSVAKLNNQLFWLGADTRGGGVVYASSGYQGVRRSDHMVEWQIQQYSTLSDAVAYTYQQDGHPFYVLNFPSAGKTWAFDLATGLWHERAALVNGQFTRHQANTQIYYNNMTIVGDYANGNLYELDQNTYDDAGAPQKWLRTWRALDTDKNDMKRSLQHSLQIYMEAGVGLPYFEGASTAFNLITESGNRLITTGTPSYMVTTIYNASSGFDPQVMLRWSDDGGHTWSNEHWASLGKLGNYQQRVIWRRLGMTTKLRDRIYELSGTDPVKIAIITAEIVGNVTNA